MGNVQLSIFKSGLEFPHAETVNAHWIFLLSLVTLWLKRLHLKGQDFFSVSGWKAEHKNTLGTKCVVWYWRVWPVCTPCCCPLKASRRCRRCWGEPAAATSGCRRTSWRRWSDRRWSSPTPYRAPCYSGTLMGESIALTVYSLMWLYGGDWKKRCGEEKKEKQREGKLNRTGDSCKEMY